MSIDDKIIEIDSYEFSGTPSADDIILALTGIDVKKEKGYRAPITKAIKSTFEEATVDEELDRIENLRFLHAINFLIMVDGVNSPVIGTLKGLKTPKPANKNFVPKM